MKPQRLVTVVIPAYNAAAFSFTMIIDSMGCFWWPKA